MDRPPFPPGTREDEIALWDAFGTPDCQYPYEAGPKLGMKESRVRYLCIKWQHRGWYRYSLSPEYGSKIYRG